MAYDFSTVTVLLADDNDAMRKLMAAMLSEFGFGKIITARNGKEAFEKFQEERPDIIVSDWMMNPVSGIELAKMIRNDHKSPDPYVPFILMTGFSEKRRVLFARDSGITEFMVKPFSALDLYKRIRTVIEHPREFVKSVDFFGPDRRRKLPEDYEGPFRRSADDDVDVEKGKFEVDVSG
ncbi:MAG: response regulator [Pseudobdellovibrionaceae bacterium]